MLLLLLLGRGTTASRDAVMASGSPTHRFAALDCKSHFWKEVAALCSFTHAARGSQHIMACLI